ncbi:hypothetical protein J3E69DRAFT_351869 [Trichoderma sp. SZMC 28015]
MIGCRSYKHTAEEQHDICLDDHIQRIAMGVTDQHGQGVGESIYIKMTGSASLKDSSSLFLNSGGLLPQYHQHGNGISLC